MSRGQQDNSFHIYGCVNVKIVQTFYWKIFEQEGADRLKKSNKVKGQVGNK